MRDMQGYNFSRIDNNKEYKVPMLKTFGGNIKKYRHRKKLTQERVGEMAGINPKYLGEIERGEKNPTATVIYKLSKALDVNVSEILSFKDCPFLNKNLLKEVERLFDGREEKDKQKAIRILEVFFE